jgi:uncharacterized protein YybS (DUF2232 family)
VSQTPNPSATVRLRERPDPRTGGAPGAALAAAALYGACLKVWYLLPLALASPFPLMVARLRGGLGAGALGAILAAALLATFFRSGAALGFLLFLAVPGLLMTESLARGRGLVRGCGWAFAWLAGWMTVGLVFANPWLQTLAVSSFDPLQSATFLADMRASGVDPAKVEAWAEQVALLQRAVGIVYPAAYIIGCALVVLANATLLRLYLRRRDPAWLDGDEFEGIRWPLGLAVLFVASGLAVLAPGLRPAAYNVLLVLAFFFALQGLAVVAFYTHRLAAPPLLRGAVLFLVLANPWAPQILALIGLFDIWINFRKWAEPPEAPRG